MKRARRVYLPVRLWVAAAIPFVLLAAGTAGFKATGGPEWTWVDALYMSAITLTTVGYGETHPLDTDGRLFAIVLAFSGIFLLFYTATEMIRAVVSGQFRAILGREGMKHALADIGDHIIVCGLGRMGRLVCQQFDRHKTPYVVVDRNETLLAERPRETGIPVHGDATDDEVLKLAGVERAKVLIAVLPSDADNLYVTLSSRVMNPNLFIVARAEQESSEPKLRRVGANQVVSPYVIGGHRVAQAVLRPNVGHFMEQATRMHATELQIEEVTVREDSTLCGKSLRQSELSEKLGVVVITMRLPGGEMMFNPKADTIVQAGNVLVVVGRREHLDELEKLAGATRRHPGPK